MLKQVTSYNHHDHHNPQAWNSTINEIAIPWYINSSFLRPSVKNLCKHKWKTNTFYNEDGYIIYPFH